MLMANYCDYTMKVVGKKQDIHELLNILNREYDYNDKSIVDRHLLGNMASRIAEETNDYTIIKGQCLWSVAHAMFNDEDNPEMYALTTLDVLTQELGLKLELYSQERSFCFQEHILVDQGEILTSERGSYLDLDIEGWVKTKEEANEKLGIELTDDEWNNLYVYRYDFEEVWHI